MHECEHSTRYTFLEGFVTFWLCTLVFVYLFLQQKQLDILSCGRARRQLGRLLKTLGRLIKSTRQAEQKKKKNYVKERRKKTADIMENARTFYSCGGISYLFACIGNDTVSSRFGMSRLRYWPAILLMSRM